jgi:alpha-beta hydrolase superfamily lysophospholipase
MIRTRAVLVAAALALPPSFASAQDSARIDLSGDWKGSLGSATLSGRATDGSSDTYQVGVTIGSRSLQGTATFDGQRLSFSSPEVAGFVRALAGEKAAGGATSMSFDYLRDTGTDRLLSGQGDLSRSRAVTADGVTPGGSWGSRSQIEATIKELDGVSGKAPPSSIWDFLSRNPLTSKVADFFEPGLSTSDETKKLSDFVASKEKEWGAPVSDLPAGAIKNQDLFEAQKAIALARYGRSPADVTEGFVDARGSVDGQPIAARKIFWQRWKPIGKPSGRLVVISPGFQETGRNFYQQIQLLNKEGDDVIVMDQQWAGYSEGTPGALDRGFGVARDVAAVAAFAHEAAPSEKLVLFGNSMGAGPGVLGAATLNDHGKIQLDGPAMPTGVPIVLQAPYLKTTDSLLNDGLEGMAHVPFVNGLELPSMGLPVLTHDKTAAATAANEAVAEDVRAESKTLLSANADIATITGMIKNGQGPTGPVYVLAEKGDPLADPSASEAVVRELGSKAKMDLLDGDDHVLEESPSEQRYFLAGIKWVTGG